MSILDEQLKELQGRKLKVEFFNLLKKNIGSISDPKFKSVEKEVKDDLFTFIQAQVDMIEGGEVKSKSEINELFNEDTVKTLLILAEKVKSKQTSSRQTQEPVKQADSLENQLDYSKADKISFALQYRHLGGKDIKVSSQGGAKGKVVGVDAPYIVVQLLNGQTVSVPPKDIMVWEKIIKLEIGFTIPSRFDKIKLVINCIFKGVLNG